MPVRSLSSSVLAWPTAEQVVGAARYWALPHAESESVLAIGYYGSYARGDWGVGSDLDLVVVLADGSSAASGIDWQLESLPVPAEVRVYSASEWNALLRSDLRMAKVLREETVWLVGGEAFQLNGVS